MSLTVSEDFINKYIKQEKKRKKEEDDDLYVSDEFLSRLNATNDDDDDDDGNLRVSDAFLTWMNTPRNDDDIAPVGNMSKQEKLVPDEEKKESLKWYEDGLFKDGYDLGDVTKTILGVKDDTASLLDLTWNSAKRGYYNSLYGEELYKDMTGVANQKDAYKNLLESEEYQFAPGNTFAEGVSGAFELIGQMGKQVLDPTNAALALSAGGAAALAGQLGPQILAPEEIISVPTAAAAGFYTVGMYDVTEKNGEKVKETANQYVTDYADLDLNALPE